MGAQTVGGEKNIGQPGRRMGHERNGFDRKKTRTDIFWGEGSGHGGVKKKAHGMGGGRTVVSEQLSGRKGYLYTFQGEKDREKRGVGEIQKKLGLKR